MDKKDIEIPYQYYNDNNSTSNHLVFKIDSDIKVIDYQIEMIRRNSIDSIIEVKTILKNDSFNLYYDITDKVTLQSFLENNTLIKDDVINIIGKILKILLESQEYMLYENSFILKKEMIYIDRKSFNIEMVYIPVKDKSNISSTFKTFLTDLINTSISLDNPNRDDFLQKIIDYLHNDGFNIQKFYLYLDAFENSVLKKNYKLESWIENEDKIQAEFISMFDDEDDISNGKHVDQDSDYIRDSQISSYKHRKLEEGSNEEKQKHKGQKRATGIGERFKKMKGSKEVVNKEKRVAVKKWRKKKINKFIKMNRNKTKDDSNSKNKEIYMTGDSSKLKSYLSMGLIESLLSFTQDNLRKIIGISIQILIIIALFLSRNIINNINENPMPTYIGIGVIITAIDIILYKSLLKEKITKNI